MTEETKKQWTAEEFNILLLHYETKTDEELKELLPGRNCRSMSGKIGEYNRQVKTGKIEGIEVNRPPHLCKYIRKKRIASAADNELPEYDYDIFNQEIITEDIYAYRYGWQIDSKITF